MNSTGSRWDDVLGTRLSAGAFWFLAALFVGLLAFVSWEGLPALVAVTGAPPGDGSAPVRWEDLPSGGIAALVFGTVRRVFWMTLIGMPLGVATAVYLNEYARPGSHGARWLRTAIALLAGIPGVVAGIFGLGFLVAYGGGALDAWSGGGTVHARPGLLWCAATMALLTLPSVVVSTEEGLRSVSEAHRDAAMALGSTRLQFLVRVALPGAVPGMITGGLLAVGRAAGEVSPLIFTGAAFSADPSGGGLWDRFMDLGYHLYVLTTQAPDPARARVPLAAVTWTLLVLTLSMNLAAVFLRSRFRNRRLPNP